MRYPQMNAGLCKDATLCNAADGRNFLSWSRHQTQGVSSRVARRVLTGMQEVVDDYRQSISDLRTSDGDEDYSLRKVGSSLLGSSLSVSN